MKHIKKFESLKRPQEKSIDITICENAREMKNLLEGRISEVIKRLRDLESKYGTEAHISLYVDDYSTDPYSEVDSSKNKITINTKKINEGANTNQGNIGISSIIDHLTPEKYIIYRERKLDPKPWEEKHSSPTAVQISKSFKPMGSIEGSVIPLWRSPSYYGSGAIRDMNQDETNLILDDESIVFEAELIEGKGRSAKVGDFIYDAGWKEITEVIHDNSLPAGNNTYQIKNRYKSDPITIYSDTSILRPTKLLYKP